MATPSRSPEEVITRGKHFANILRLGAEGLLQFLGSRLRRWAFT